LVTSSTQGRVFEVGSDGSLQFEFINAYNQRTGETLFVSEALSIDVDYLGQGKLPECKGHES
jgi:hypothetical protein